MIAFLPLSPRVLHVGDWGWWALVAAATVGLLAATAYFGFAGFVYSYACREFGDQIVRIFEERPLFVIPRGNPVDGAEDVTLPGPDGLELRGCYLHTPRPRKGVILFGLEFGSNRWSAVQYCESLVESGYDVFAYEPRNQGQSGVDASYTPLQWVTDRDLADQRAAIAYLKSRPDAPERGIGLFGISKGGSVGLLAAASDRWITCIATDGSYAAYTTMVPYMRRWVSIYSPRKNIQAWMPDWLYGGIGLHCMARSAAKRGVRFLSVEKAIRRLRQPLLMIHGGGDTYIKPEMTARLYSIAGTKHKDLWLVPRAKHNQALHVAGEEYTRRLLAFFDANLADPTAADSGLIPTTETPSPIETVVAREAVGL